MEISSKLITKIDNDKNSKIKGYQMLSKTITHRLSVLLLLGSALLTAKVIASEQVPTGQLPTNVEPTHYQLTLKIDPEQERFSGQTSIDVNSFLQTVTLV